jgi:glycosyltransferase involved in cell wall biosynthesis
LRHLLSIIVPVYNVEEYLPKCIESILNQTLTNYELILVNDGSSDNSGNICDKFAQKDDRIVVIHKENGGLSDARNTGLNIAIGKYIAFVDSDDFIIESAYELMINEAEKYELDLIAGYAFTYIDENRFYPKIKKRKFDNAVYIGVEFLCMSINEGSMSMCSVLNIYRRELITANDLYFKKNLLHEDEHWTPRVFLEAKRVKYIDLDFYAHRVREDSITKQKDQIQNGLDIIAICYDLESVYRDIQNKHHRNTLNDYLVTLYLNGFYVGKLYSSKYTNVIKNRFLIGKAKSKRNKIKVLLFLINKKFYYALNRTIKEFKNRVLDICKYGGR